MSGEEPSVRYSPSFLRTLKTAILPAHDRLESSDATAWSIEMS